MDEPNNLNNKPGQGTSTNQQIAQENNSAPLVTQTNTSESGRINKIFNSVFYILIISYVLFALITPSKDNSSVNISVFYIINIIIEIILLLSPGTYLIAGIIIAIRKNNSKWMIKPVILTAIAIFSMIIWYINWIHLNPAGLG